MTDDDRSLPLARRQLLAALAATGMAATAGCSEWPDRAIPGSDGGGTATPTEIGYGGSPTASGSTDSGGAQSTEGGSTATLADEYGVQGYGGDDYGG